MRPMGHGVAAVFLVLGLTASGLGAEVESADKETVSELEVLVRELLDRVEVMNARIHALEENQAELLSRLRSAEAARAATDDPEEATPPVVLPRRNASEIAELYQAAVVLQANGRYDEAIEALTDVYEADPNGDLADNALFWIGETYFARGDLQLAIKIYERIAVDYSDQNKAPDALLKASRAYGRMGDLMQAQKVIDRLIEEYPYSTAAVAARAERDRYRY